MRRSSKFINARPGTGWLVSPGVRSIHTEDGVVVLDIRHAQCYSLNGLAARVWVAIRGSPAGISFMGIVEVLGTHFIATREELERAVRDCLIDLQLSSLVEAMVVGSTESEVDRISLPLSDGSVGQHTLEGGQTILSKQPFVERLETLESLIDRVLPQGVKSNADPRVIKLKDAIDAAPAKVNESLGHVCSQLQLSLTERQAQRLFKEAAGISMRDYTRKKRLVFAARQLQDSDQPIKVIATNAGYQSYYGFRKAFHDMFQLTPVEFRRFWQSGLCHAERRHGRRDRRHAAA
ncbi:MAG TPA: PqqD family peptide modification chaperone [Candidatus Dormibacteraeota bacterium]|nr:PqqD family peptide modification chaperone [Candidatus Dormibacteraeota bacterium]